MLFIDHLVDESTTEAMIEISFYRLGSMSVAADGSHFEQLLTIR
jgi:hypothetical protein